MTTLMTNTADRLAHREACRRMRTNAGLHEGARPDAIADYGAAARRLRASNTWEDSGSRNEVAVGVREQAARVDATYRASRIADRAESLLSVLASERAL